MRLQGSRHPQEMERGKPEADQGGGELPCSPPRIIEENSVHSEAEQRDPEECIENESLDSTALARSVELPSKPVA